MLILLSSLFFAEAKNTPFIAPKDGSLWDFIESQSLSQAYSQQEIVQAGLSDTEPLLPFFSDQMIGSAEKSFYLDPVQALQHDPLFVDMIDPNDFDIPIVVNDDVKRWMNYMLGSGRKYYSKWLSRSTRYTPLMQEKLKAAGLPQDMIYLSMIESGFKTSAYSTAAAAGLWQFIPTTGREMGLRVDWWIDERRDPEKSTDAAIKYLSRLYNKFDDWYLVWAGYNGGPTRVARAVSKHETKDFWELAQKNSFPSETDNYVPKIIAAAIIGKYKERYGFTDIQYQSPLEYDIVTVDKNIGIDVLAKCAGISSAQFSALNPELNQTALPPTPAKQQIKIPKEQETAFVKALAKIPPSERVTYLRHVIKKGETLGTIAKKYNVSVSSLQTVNRIKNANRISVGQVLMIPAPGQTGLVSTSTQKSSSSKNSSKSSSSKKGTLVYHKVRAGENLNLIAKKYDVTASQIKSWNNIKNANKIYAGQRLKIYSNKVVWTSYTVRSGDNLTKIANKYGCSVADIQKWNKLSSSKIYVGQKLKIQK